MSHIIACDLTAIPADERAIHMARASRLLFMAYAERQELPNGFAWRFGVDEYDELRQYIANERRCCPFFTFEMEVVTERRALWLRITGNAEIKVFLQSELDHYASLAAVSIPSTPLADADEALIVCDLTALASGEEEALTELSKQLLFIVCEERRELLDGYAWRYSVEHFDDVCRFIDGDSRCCAFFTPP